MTPWQDHWPLGLFFPAASTMLGLLVSISFEKGRDCSRALLCNFCTVEQICLLWVGGTEISSLATATSNKYYHYQFRSSSTYVSKVRGTISQSRTHHHLRSNNAATCSHWSESHVEHLFLLSSSIHDFSEEKNKTSGSIALLWRAYDRFRHQSWTILGIIPHFF